LEEVKKSLLRRELQGSSSVITRTFRKLECSSSTPTCFPRASSVRNYLERSSKVLRT